MNTLALLPNLAGPDMLIIFLIVLIMFGAKKLPELARGLGQAVKEFSKAKEDVNNEFNRAAYASHSEEPQLPFQGHQPGSQHASSQGSYGSGLPTTHAPTGGTVSAVPASSGSAADSASSHAHAAPVSSAASSVGTPDKSSV
jgi:sec-independent protein translocase protein TatA